MKLGAIVFDFGMVLTMEPKTSAHDMLRSLTKLPHEEFERRYWADRHAYDRGDLNGVTFWQRVTKDSELPASIIAELNKWDADMWSHENTRMVAWQKQLKAQGFKTAILSNMGDAVHAGLEANFAWIEDFDVHVWSYQHNIAKPEAAIYQVLLEKLGTRPEETLFIDDKIENIEAAQAAGINALQFTTVEKLREDLIVSRLGKGLPLPSLT